MQATKKSLVLFEQPSLVTLGGIFQKLCFSWLKIVSAWMKDQIALVQMPMHVFLFMNVICHVIWRCKIPSAALTRQNLSKTGQHSGFDKLFHSKKVEGISVLCLHVLLTSAFIHHRFFDLLWTFKSAELGTLNWPWVWERGFCLFFCFFCHKLAFVQTQQGQIPGLPLQLALSAGEAAHRK